MVDASRRIPLLGNYRQDSIGIVVKQQIEERPGFVQIGFSSICDSGQSLLDSPHISANSLLRGFGKTRHELTAGRDYI